MNYVATNTAIYITKLPPTTTKLKNKKGDYLHLLWRDIRNFFRIISLHKR
jgi:hypothetical protein